MNLTLFSDFISDFDKPGAIILLEGKREVKHSDQEKLVALGKLLAESSKHMIFRSGNAPGADEYFSQGICSVDSSRLQVVVPYSTHREESNHAATTYSLDEIDILSEPQLINQTKANKKNVNIVDQYAKGKENKSTEKAAYLIRDTLKVIGSSNIKPATFAIFYDDLKNPGEGGTGHTMDVCKKNGVLLITQKLWFKWL